MFKKIFIISVLLLTFQVANAKEIPVNIQPVCKITTSNVSLQEGDNVNFVVKEDVIVNSKMCLKKNDKVTGVITSLEENDYLYKPAALYMDNFVLTETDGKSIKLKGIVYKTGNNHALLTQFIPFPCYWLRGGEVQIKPQKDVFTLIFEDKND